MMRLEDTFLRATERLQRAFRRSTPGMRRWAAMLVDAAIVLESLAVALLFRFEGDVQGEFWLAFWPFAIFGAVLFVVLLRESGVYQSILRYTGIYQGVRIASATSIATGILLILSFGVDELFLGYRPVPIGVILIGAVLAYLQLVAVRLYPRVFYELSLREVGRRRRTVIVGTDEPGVALSGHIWRTASMDTQVVGFVGDDESEVGKHIEGVPVVGTVEGLQEVIARQGVDQVIIATPQVDREQVDRIWRTSLEASAEIKVMPDIGEVLDQSSFKLRELQIEDLLGREPVDIDLETISEHISGKRVLVTGAGGSIGKELSRQISRLGPSRLVLLDRDESGLYYLQEELLRDGFSASETLMGDVTLPERLGFVFERYRPQVVFHAAAYKHVPMMELQATEAIVNNVFGTLNVARTAGEYGAEKFVNVSTDKAVNPVNVMGATKRLAETIVRSFSEEYPETVYASVRFGNVLGSRGSVVPTFRQQIEAGGPVTVTHPKMIRYFMTIPEAVSLILQASAMSGSYGTYVLEMGRPVAIADLASKMIEVMGARGVQIKYTGLRPGEKLREELFGDDEHQLSTEHSMVFQVVPDSSREPGPQQLSNLVNEMVYHAQRQNGERALKLLHETVPSYSRVEAPELPGRSGLY